MADPPNNDVIDPSSINADSSVTDVEDSSEQTLSPTPVAIVYMNNSSPVSMDDLCRLCLERCTGNMQRIFDDISLPNTITTLARLEVEEGDGLPEKVCQECIHQIKSTEAFVSQCRASDVTLREYLFKLELAQRSLGGNKNGAQRLAFNNLMNLNHPETFSDDVETVDDDQDSTLNDQSTENSSEDVDSIEMKLDLMHNGPSMKSYLRNGDKLANGKMNASEMDPLAEVLLKLKNGKRLHNNGKSGSNLQRKLFKKTLREKVNDYKKNAVNTLLSPSYHVHPSTPVTVCLTSTDTSLTKEAPHIEVIEEVVDITPAVVVEEIDENGEVRIASDETNTHSTMPMYIKTESDDSQVLVETIRIVDVEETMGNNGEITYFDVQEEVVIECEEVVMNSEEFEEGVYEEIPTVQEHSVDMPGVSGIKQEQELNDDYPFACEICTKSFKRKNALLSHMKLHAFISFNNQSDNRKANPKAMFKCDRCTKCYGTKAGLNMHRQRVHEGGKIPCTQCDMRFESKGLLANHLKRDVHKVYKCNRCSKTFTSRKLFAAHTQVHPQHIYKCTTCMETFGSNEAMNEHLKTHKAHDVATGTSLPVVRTEAQVEQFQRMKFEYCLSYVGLVKSMFNDQPDMYNGFLETIKDFKFQRINVQGLLVKISQLFKDHRELIAGFNTFMPHGFKIDLPADERVSALTTEVSPADQAQGPDMDLDYSLSYLSQIKSMFANQPKIYNDFTFIIKEYKLQTMEIPEVIRRVSHLFRDYPELIAGFNSFLPPWCKIKVPGIVIKKEKEDIDPLSPSQAGPSTESPTPCNGEYSKTKADGPSGVGRRVKRKVSAAGNVDRFNKKVKMELISNDKVIYNNINETAEPLIDTQDPTVVEEFQVESQTYSHYQEGEAEPQNDSQNNSQNIVATITSLCNQLQTIVDNQSFPGALPQEAVEQSYANEQVEEVVEHQTYEHNENEIYVEAAEGDHYEVAEEGHYVEESSEHVVYADEAYQEEGGEHVYAAEESSEHVEYAEDENTNEQSTYMEESTTEMYTEEDTTEHETFTEESTTEHEHNAEGDVNGQESLEEEAVEEGGIPAEAATDRENHEASAEVTNSEDQLKEHVKAVEQDESTEESSVRLNEGDDNVDKSNVNSSAVVFSSFVCHICLKSFPKRVSLQNHMQTHSSR